MWLIYSFLFIFHISTFPHFTTLMAICTIYLSVHAPLSYMTCRWGSAHANEALPDERDAVLSSPFLSFHLALSIHPYDHSFLTLTRSHSLTRSFMNAVCCQSTTNRPMSPNVVNTRNLMTELIPTYPNCL